MMSVTYNIYFMFPVVSSVILSAMHDRVVTNKEINKRITLLFIFLKIINNFI